MHSTSPVMIVNRFIPKEKLNFKKIMVGVDFSKSCKYACEFAAKLALKYNSKLSFFHMSSPKESEKEGEEKIQKFYKTPEGIEYEYKIWAGTQPYTEILKLAREKEIDLIVMGSHTRDESERVYVGSAVEHVSAESLCPVVIVTHPDAVLKIEK
ncbi:MAG: universal stress protein [Nitrospirae bacterium]|nr:universal stress protein [Nitrospirota bacterium]